MKKDEITIQFSVKKTILICTLLIFALQEFNSQSLFNFNQTFEKNDAGYISLNFNGGYDSDGINSDLFQSFIKGGFIDRNTRLESAPNSTENVSLGMGYSSELILSFPWQKIIKRDSTNAIVVIGQEQSIASDYNDTFYNLLFFGNEQYRGETPSFQDIRFENWTTRSVGFGLLNRKNGNKAILKIHQGLSRQNYEFESGSTFVSEDGLILNAEVNANLFDNTSSSDSSNTLNGFGFGLDGRVRLLRNKKVGEFYFSYRNVGLMIWPKTIQETKLNGLYSFDGVDLSDVFSPDFSSAQLGDFNNYFDVNKSEAENIELLPIKLQMDYFKKISSKVDVNLRLASWMINNWTPQMDLMATYSINKNWKIGGGLKYGGFGNINYNLQTAISIQNRWYINLDMLYLSGWLYKTGYGSYVNLGVTRSLKFKKVNS